MTFKRIDSLLMMEEMKEYYTGTSNPDDAVEFSNVTSMWDVVEKTNVIFYYAYINIAFSKLFCF